MVYHLVKKDFLLAKKYWTVMLIAGLVLPIFIKSKVDFMPGGFLAFFLSTLFIQYLLFNTVSMIEYKSKGSALLCATPYTRRTIVIAKYFFLLAIFAGCYLLYSFASLLIPAKMEMLSLSEVGVSILVMAAVFGVMIPVQYRFGYEKSKYIFMFLIFLFPFVFPQMIRAMQFQQIGLQNLLPLPGVVQVLFLGLLALSISWISMECSARIYAKQNL
ncbi:ABC-2 transporter permease [Brevibacillus ruminantium]|uniref:ABC-2 transporter permease n=1 Tax=Brevibacillus ruminantium TaxID=2950604 RepID=A0ABY4WFU3_9BACL|nr:ABC-2 transporter permease [Brevibacillus ruminantium]USG65701.1 ABC-2 transporter permease [Brevibacillus ruminantium]